jgi:hypothetical protein
VSDKIISVQTYPMETQSAYVMTTIVDGGPVTFREALGEIAAFCIICIVQASLLAASVLCFLYAVKGIFQP